MFIFFAILHMIYSLVVSLFGISSSVVSMYIYFPSSAFSLLTTLLNIFRYLICMYSLNLHYKKQLYFVSISHYRRINKCSKGTQRCQLNFYLMWLIQYDILLRLCEFEKGKQNFYHFANQHHLHYLIGRYTDTLGLWLAKN